MTSPAARPRSRTPGLGVIQGTALYIASVLGTGLLVLPGLAAEAAGPASIVAVLAVIGLSVPLAGTFAVLAARYPDPGGVASYVRRALGGTAARMTGSGQKDDSVVTGWRWERKGVKCAEGGRTDRPRTQDADRVRRASRTEP